MLMSSGFLSIPQKGFAGYPLSLLVMQVTINSSKTHTHPWWAHAQHMRDHESMTKISFTVFHPPNKNTNSVLHWCSMLWKDMVKACQSFVTLCRKIRSGKHHCSWRLLCDRRSMGRRAGPTRTTWVWEWKPGYLTVDLFAATWWTGRSPGLDSSGAVDGVHMTPQGVAESIRRLRRVDGTWVQRIFFLPHSKANANYYGHSS